MWSRAFLSPFGYSVLNTTVVASRRSHCMQGIEQHFWCEVRRIVHHIVYCIVCISMVNLCIVSYNPQCAWTYDRLVDICDVCHKAHILALAGTSKKQISSECEQRRFKQYQVLEWGWTNDRGSNKSCGVSLLINNKVFPKINAVFSPPKCIAGRAGAVRMKRADLDVLAIVCYFAPDQSKHSHREANLQICKWVRALCGRMPNRCCILLTGDFNAKSALDPSGFIGNVHTRL